jgi:hypothetical protein
MFGLMEALAGAGRRVSAVTEPDEGRGPDGASLALSMELLSGSDGRLVAERLGLARALESGELPASGVLAIGRFVFDRAVFARAEGFIRAAVGGKACAEVLGIDEIGHLELMRGEGLMHALEFALEAASGPGGPRVLVCSAREDCASELRQLAHTAGLRTVTFEPPFGDGCLVAVRKALGS